MARSLASSDAQARCLALEPLTSLSAKLRSWRSDHEVVANAPGRVFDFVKGLRFSANLIYIIRDAISHHSLEVDWGQIVAENGACLEARNLSPECDIIIHKPGYHRRWNGGRSDKVMDFRFILASNVVAIISCKSLLNQVTKTEKKYCEKLLPYMIGKKLWLFAECVPSGRENGLAKVTREAGFKKFWYLYSWDSKQSITREDKKLWIDFLDEVKKLGQKMARTKKRKK